VGKDKRPTRGGRKMERESGLVERRNSPSYKRISVQKDCAERNAARSRRLRTGGGRPLSKLRGEEEHSLQKGPKIDRILLLF